MESEKIRNWIRIIAGWSLLLTICSATSYGLIHFRVIEVQLKTLDHIIYIIDTIAGLIIFISLWKLTSWGWKFTIIFTLISWIYSIFDLVITYERFTGVITAPFIIMEALILRFLLKPDVQHFFNISSKFFIRLNWIPTAVFLLAVFLIVNDFFGGFIGIGTVIGISLDLRVSKKYKKDLTSSKIKQQNPADG